MDGDPPYWRILGRTSVDIIKSAGYKVSALGIESVLLAHPAVAECAVVGLPDDALGERIAAVVACKDAPVSKPPPPGAGRRPARPPGEEARGAPRPASVPPAYGPRLRSACMISGWQEHQPA
jgi:malonyl-CoA/methylmalonyl-CoA synthetase